MDYFADGFDTPFDPLFFAPAWSSVVAVSVSGEWGLAHAWKTLQNGTHCCHSNINQRIDIVIDYIHHIDIPLLRLPGAATGSSTTGIFSQIASSPSSSEAYSSGQS
jgi:hypothetical protein